MTWNILLSKQAMKDVKKIKQAGLSEKLKGLLMLLESNPFAVPPRYEFLVGNLDSFYSRRINIKHRLVYAVDEKERVVHVLRCWTHYE